MAFTKTDGSKPTVAELRHYREMQRELQDLQAAMEDHWTELSLPSDWNGLEDRVKTLPPYERLNLRMDADVLRWFRKMGIGYTRRINQVLRIYMEGVQSGAVKSRHYEPLHGRPGQVDAPADEAKSKDVHKK